MVIFMQFPVMLPLTVLAMGHVHQMGHVTVMMDTLEITAVKVWISYSREPNVAKFQEGLKSTNA